MFPRLVAREQLGRRASPRLILEIDVGKLLPVVIAHDVARRLFLDDSRWWEAAHRLGESSGSSLRVAWIVEVSMPPSQIMTRFSVAE
jgi:hypothetical protein